MFIFFLFFIFIFTFFFFLFLFSSPFTRIFKMKNNKVCSPLHPFIFFEYSIILSFFEHLDYFHVSFFPSTFFFFFFFFEIFYYFTFHSSSPIFLFFFFSFFIFFNLTQQNSSPPTHTPLPTEPLTSLSQQYHTHSQHP